LGSTTPIGKTLLLKCEERKGELGKRRLSPERGNQPEGAGSEGKRPERLGRAKSKKKKERFLRI